MTDDRTNVSSISDKVEATKDQIEEAIDAVKEKVAEKVDRV